MLKKFEFFAAKRYLKAKRKGLFTIITTVIAIAGISVGVAALVTTLSVMNGFQHDIQEKIIGAQAHIVVYGKMDADIYEKFEKILHANPLIESSAPAIYGQAILTVNNNSTGVVLRGLDPEKEKKVNKLDKFLIKGSWHLPKGETLPPIVLGQELAYNMSIVIGDEIVLISPQSVATSIGTFPRMKKFKVSGFIKTGYYDFDNTMVYTGLKSASEFLNLKEQITGISIKLFDIDKSEEVASKLSKILSFGYAVKTFAQINSTLYAALKLEKYVMFLILTLIVFVAALNIASNLILLSIEKTRDIGILKAIGATPKQIQKIFWWEGLMIGTTGIILGILLGLGLCWVIANHSPIELPSDIYYLTKVPVAVRWQDIVVIILGSYFLCFLAILYPAYRSSKINPVEAIRYG
ncbi:MAG TPA: FtsX-like permease family protein [Elusimicrobiales bacterium]|nr:FtsX-like permease family protein [Elusimicrobiales bacterium]